MYLKQYHESTSLLFYYQCPTLIQGFLWPECKLEYSKGYLHIATAQTKGTLALNCRPQCRTKAEYKADFGGPAQDSD